MNRRASMLCLVWALLALPALAAHADSVDEEKVWSALRNGAYVVLIRHAVTEPGIGDPPGFEIGKCATQRNLSVQGKADAKRIGDAFRRRAIPISEVLSSRWCRCVDTAMLAFGKATPLPMLDSMFNDREKPADEKIREVFAAIERRPASGNLILVTHNQNIQALTGVSPTPGEMVVVSAAEPGKLKLVGRLDVPRP